MMLVDCEKCGAAVDAQVLHQYSETVSDEQYQPYTERFSFARCLICKNPLLLSETEWADDQDFGKPVRLFPPIDAAFLWSIPQPIEDSFSEATKCFRAKAFTAAAIMCRKTLEGISADHGVTGANLAKKLASLKDKGVIEGRLLEWAHELRLVGNEAAHDVAVQVMPQDARDTIDFTRAVLQYAYTLRDRFEEFKQRQAKRKAAKTGSTSRPASAKSQV